MANERDLRTTLLRDDSASSRGSRTTNQWTFPPDLLTEAVRRLHASALLYALAYFLAAFGPAIFLPTARATLLATPRHWIPGVLSISGGLLIAWLVTRPGLRPRQKLFVGLGFEILGAFGIAAAEYQDISSPIIEGRFGIGGFGLSWVAAFVLLFSVVVPTPPRVTLVLTGLSVATVPLVYAAGVALGSNVPLPAGHFFFVLVFPYLIITLMAYVGSRVVYRLGSAVREAREMGSYRLVQRLGAGGMGEVWRARHRMLARPAAIKLIRPEVLGARDEGSRQVLLKRFEREAQATALMRSPHTMQLYDYGVAEDGTFYYVMELLDGFDLDQMVRRFGPVAPERAVHFLRQMCASLAEAHDAGLIHRDIKPANIYACRYGREVDFVKVLDFGLVKHGGSPDATGGGEIAAEGTPAFMAPEQALAEGMIDARSDIYALGCVAYWLLAGSLVFKGTTLVETIAMHAHRVPEPPSRRVSHPIPSQLEAIVLDCLAKDPDGRPQTADELAARLGAVVMLEEWTEDRARDWWDRHRPLGDKPGRLLEAAVR